VRSILRSSGAVSLSTLVMLGISMQ
jgi:hypothetical protein